MIGTSHILARRSDVSRPAVFLDRDGTLTAYRGYITTPQQLELTAGAVESVRHWSAAGYLCVLITNQSAIGRGMISENDLAAIHDRLIAMLAAEGASLDAIYFCPEVPRASDELSPASEDRKPGTGMLLRAAADLDLDLSESWMIGDRFSDVLAGQRAGCKGSIRVRSGYQYSGPDPDSPGHYHTMDTVQDAANFILSGEAICSECNLI
jgi:D-glycero-D-manno-heptose 1,7-bisphosphate phosphatase